jgi:uncharacterized protein
MKTVVFCDDTYHPAATVRTGLAPLATDHGFNFDWVADATNWSPTALENYSVAVLSKSNVLSATDKTLWLHGGNETIFRDHVAGGGGLVVVHSGTASYKEIGSVRAVTGGTFIGHPPQCLVTLKPIPNHPLTTGLTDAFEVFDEHYLMELDDADADVFLTSHSAHGTQPAGWARCEGRGRVCVLTPGHNPEVWLHPSFQQLLMNALRWVTPPASASLG